MSMKKMRKILILLKKMTASHDVIFDEKDGDVEVEVKVINEKADGKEEEKPEKEESADDTEETETINLEEV